MRKTDYCLDCRWHKDNGRWGRHYCVWGSRSCVEALTFCKDMGGKDTGWRIMPRKMEAR